METLIVILAIVAAIFFIGWKAKEVSKSKNNSSDKGTHRYE